ncbi:MAG: energy transducer TonB [Bacteroidota bacterium]|nr:energy transducer TonB [Bacteroidota bacterium]
MNRIRLFCIFMFCLVFMNLIASGQDDLQLSQPLLEDPKDEGIKYYIKIIPGDTTVGQNMPMYRPDSKVFTEPQVKSVFENPKPIVTVKPNISEIEITKPVKVWVKCFVDEEGNVKEVKILKSDLKILNDPVLKAVTQWKFKPAVLNGKVYATYVSIPFEFTPKE